MSANEKKTKSDNMVNVHYQEQTGFKKTCGVVSGRKSADNFLLCLTFIITRLLFILTTHTLQIF